MFSQAFSVIIYRGVSAPGHIIEVVGGINSTDKSVLFQLISTVKLPRAKMYDTYMIMHPSTSTEDINLAR